MRRRMGRPGLAGTMARTAVIAGTATAASGAVSGSKQATGQAAAQQQSATAQTSAQMADMKAQGLLSDEEFTAMKAKLMGA
jgi:hypothetical protein